jgi:hypothetical protein
MYEVANNLILESKVQGLVIETEDTSTQHIFRLKLDGVTVIDSNCNWLGKMQAEHDNTTAVRAYVSGYVSGYRASISKGS